LILNSFIEEKSIKLSLHKPSYDHWYTFKLGSSKYHLTINLLDVENRIRIALWINNDKETYDKLFTNKDKIESIYGEKLEWDRKDSRKASWVADYLSDFS